MILALLGFGWLSPTQGQEAPPALGVDAYLNSRYVWRSLVFDPDPVLQTDVWMQVRGITLTFWGNLDLTDADGQFSGQFNEWDTFLETAFCNCGGLTLGGGLYYNSFPGSSGWGSSTAEIGGWVSGSSLPAAPTVAAFWDVWQLHGVYANLSLSQTLPAGPGTFCFTTSTGWGDERHNRWSGLSDAGGWLDFQAGVNYCLPLQSWLTLTPGVQYSALLQKDIREYYDQSGVQADGLIFSLSVSSVLAP